MRKASNLLAGILAAAVCVLITYLTLDASRENIIFNLCFLGVMVAIIIAALAFGFRRLSQTQKGLDRAAQRLLTVSEETGNVSSITRQGAQLFSVRYLDDKYQEYLKYLYKTNSPTDIGDYIGEYEINNYTHRRIIEMVPDILTSLGILGTFVGLVLGLRGFNPTTYEAMSSSVSSLIDGIKVAFVTSIYGISLSMAYNYWLRGSLSGVSESLDRFLDTYYTCAVPPTDATAMNHVIANQNAQTRLMQQMSEDLAQQVAQSLESHITPLIQHLDDTMDHFSETVTLQQTQLLENISQRVARSMKQEFFSEFLEMRSVMKELNEVQKSHVRFMQSAGQQYQADFLDGEQRMSSAMRSASETVEKCVAAMNAQEEQLASFISDMSSSMKDMAHSNEIALQMTEEMASLGEMNNKISDKMMELCEANERYTKSLALVQANNSDLSEGLSVMNDANIRMTEKIAKMNDLTADTLQESVKAQSDYVKNASEYLESIRTQQETLTSEVKTQQENLRSFTDYMTQVLSRMKTLTDSSNLAMKEVSDRLAELSSSSVEEDRTRTHEQLENLIALLEEQKEREIRRDEAAAQKKGLFGSRK